MPRSTARQSTFEMITGTLSSSQGRFNPLESLYTLYVTPFSWSNFNNSCSLFLSSSPENLSTLVNSRFQCSFTSPCRPKHSSCSAWLEKYPGVQVLIDVLMLVSIQNQYCRRSRVFG